MIRRDSIALVATLCLGVRAGVIRRDSIVGVTALPGVDAPGLQCSLVEFKGPANQKQIITSMRVETASQPAVQQSADGSGVEAARASVGPLPFIRAETERSIFARRMVQGDSRNFPPITTDSEVLTALAPPARPGEPASGKLRLISYLQPLDPLYFAAGKKAVSISDYSLTLTPMVDEPAPAAAIGGFCAGPKIHLSMPKTSLASTAVVAELERPLWLVAVSSSVKVPWTPTMSARRLLVRATEASATEAADQLQ